MKLKSLAAVCLIQLAWSVCSVADLPYDTDFEDFPVGNDKIAGTDGWTISSRHTSISGLTGIEAETDHGVTGIGKAAAIGGDTDPIPTSAATISADRLVFVQHPFTYDPVTANTEVVTIAVRAGVQDSQTVARRDDFEIYVANTSAQVLAAIQFENSYLVNGVQQRRILRKSTPASGGSTLQYYSTGAQFLYGELHDVVMRINFRTNKWTAYIDGIPIFSDIPFYTGNATRNIGRVGIAMNITTGASNMLLPGDNFMLFDDILVSAAPLGTPVLSLSHTASGSATLQWPVEAGYRYQVAWSEDLNVWQTNLPDSLISASLTENTVFTDSTLGGAARRYYKVTATYP